MASLEQLLPRLQRSVALLGHKVAQEQEVSLDDLADEAALSKYHFHRLYRLAFGETCKQTQTRLQLLRVSQALNENALSAQQVAWLAGFSSAQALSKVLKRELNTNATELRQDPERLGLLMQELQLPKTQMVAPYQVSVVSLHGTEVLSVLTRDQYPELNQQYELLFEVAAVQSDILAILGLAWQDLDSDVTGVRFDCALLTAPVVSVQQTGVSLQRISGGVFLVLRHQGSYQQLGDSIDWLYAYAVTQGYQLADQPCLHHYLDDPEQVEEAVLRTDLYLPVSR